MSKTVSSFVAAFMMIAASNAAFSQDADVKQKKIKISPDQGVMIIEVDTKTGEYKIRPIDPKGGKVVHLIGELAFQKHGKQERKSQKKVVIKKSGKHGVHLHEHDGGHSHDAKIHAIDSKSENVVIVGTPEAQKLHGIHLAKGQNVVVHGKDGKQHVVVAKAAKAQDASAAHGVIVVGDGKLNKKHNVFILDDKKSKKLHQHQEQDSASDHKIPADVKEMLKKHGIKLEGGDVDIRIEKIDGGKKMRFRSDGKKDGAVKDMVLQVITDHAHKDGNVKKGSAHSYAIVDEEALAKSIEKTFGGKKSHNVDVVVQRKQEGDKKNKQEIRRHIIIDGKKGIIEGTDPRTMKFEIKDLNLDLGNIEIAELKQRIEGVKKRVQRIKKVQGEKKPSTKSKKEYNFEVEVEQDQKGQKQERVIKSGDFSFEVKPGELKGGVYRFTPKTEIVDGKKIIRWQQQKIDAPNKVKKIEFKKQDRVMEKSLPQAKSGVYRIQMRPDGKGQQGVYRLAPSIQKSKVDSPKIEKIEFKKQDNVKSRSLPQAKSGVYRIQMRPDGKGQPGVYRLAPSVQKAKVEGQKKEMKFSRSAGGQVGGQGLEAKVNRLEKRMMSLERKIDLLLKKFDK